MSSSRVWNVLSTIWLIPVGSGLCDSQRQEEEKYMTAVWWVSHGSNFPCGRRATVLCPVVALQCWVRPLAPLPRHWYVIHIYRLEINNFVGLTPLPHTLTRTLSEIICTIFIFYLQASLNINRQYNWNDSIQSHVPLHFSPRIPDDLQPGNDTHHHWWKVKLITGYSPLLSWSLRSYRISVTCYLSSHTSHSNLHPIYLTGI